jgi:hypothetical protein
MDVVRRRSPLTGGRDSQFVLFFALVVITGGLLHRMLGGLTAGVVRRVPRLPWIAETVHDAGGIHGRGPAASRHADRLLRAGRRAVGALESACAARGPRLIGTRARPRAVDNDVILRHSQPAS